MPKRKTIIAWAVAGTVLAGLFYPVRTLEVRSRQANKVIFREKTAPGDVFTFAYIHSIEKIPIEGVFAVEGDGALRVVETRFPSYAAGLPFQATGKSEDGKLMVAPGGQRLPEFSFYISPINRPSLHMGAKTLDLTNLIDSGDIVVVAVRLYPFLLMRLRHNSF